MEETNRKIGGFIPLDDFKGMEYHKSLMRFNLSRTAFLYVVMKRGYKKVYLPFYLCGCMFFTLKEQGIAYEFYHIDADFRPLLGETEDDAVVLLVNYFGSLSGEEMREYQKKYKNIIVDNTQAFFDKPQQGIDTIYSCRKWFGTADGAYLYMDEIPPDYDSLDTDASAERMVHILQRYEDNEVDNYSLYAAVEENLDTMPILKMSLLTQNILQAIDYDSISDIRRRNYGVLSEALSNDNRLKLNCRSVPFMYPFYCDNAVGIRERLKAHKCYLPVLWPNVREYPEDWIERKYGDNILLLPCDQHYTEEDMKRLVGILKENRMGY